MNALKAVPHAPYNPEKFSSVRMLWIKVIVRAAYDYALWKDSKVIGLRKMALDAERWLFEESSLLNSFDTICFYYHLPAKKIRDYARNLTREDVKKLDFLERQREESALDLLMSSPENGDS